jgi:hypothetical protein
MFGHTKKLKKKIKKKKITYMSKIDNFLSESYATACVVPGFPMTISGKPGVVAEILQFQNETVYEIAFKADDCRMYKARFNGHMYIITEEIIPEPGI